MPFSFTAPVPFRQAVSYLTGQGILPTSLNSAGIQEQLAAEFRERAFFSATMERADFLQRARNLSAEIAAGRLDNASARDQLRRFLQSVGYSAADADRGTIKDFLSDQRLNLILETNVEMARGYGQWAQDQDPAILFAWPAQELLRVEERAKPREWEGEIWPDAGGEFYEGRMIAPKNADIWTAISDFGLPYPPFKFNSGMGLRDITRKEAIRLGVIAPDETPDPQTRDFAEDAGAAADQFDAGLRDALENNPDLEIVDDVLRLVRREASEPVPGEGPKGLIGPKGPAPEPLQDWTPNGPLVGDRLMIMDQAAAGDIEHGSNLVDSVHGDGKLPRLVVSELTGTESFGQLLTDKTTGEVLGMRVAPTPDALYATVHEIGHWLDRALSGGLSAAATSAELAPWRAAIAASDGIAELMSRRQVALAAGAPLMVQRADYLLTLSEIWARSYAQFVAESSGDPALNRLVESRRVIGDGQWSKQDFAPIYRAIYELFKARGWVT